MMTVSFTEIVATLPEKNWVKYLICGLIDAHLYISSFSCLYVFKTESIGNNFHKKAMDRDCRL